jgi:predicted transglutaminase-like cysteine proteinase
MRYILAALVLTGCAQPPADLVAIHQAVGERITYKHYAKKDWRIIGPGTRAEGNCAVYAMTYKWELLRAGYKPEVILCRTWQGEGHAYTRVGEWALDNRFNGPIEINQQDCK